MKLILIFILSLAAKAALSPDIIVSGQVKSYDEKWIVLKIKNSNFKVPRNSLLSGYQLKVGNLVKAQIKMPNG